MKQNLKVIGGLTILMIGIMIWAASIGFLGDSLHFVSQSFWKPKYQNLERKTFKEGLAYNESKIEELQKYYEQYNHAELPQDKEAIRSYVMMGFSNFDDTKIENSDLRRFLIEMRNK